jgi:hypothetical protein
MYYDYKTGYYYDTVCIYILVNEYYCFITYIFFIWCTNEF